MAFSERDKDKSDLDIAKRIRRGMAMLRSEHEGNRGVVEITMCGNAAVPTLFDFVRHRDPSGLYQARCRAVEALAALGAQDKLLELLQIALNRSDPVERTGDEAVVDAAARALVGSDDESVFQTLLDVARHKHLAGVVEALGSFRRAAAIPRLIDALAEDCSRPAAEVALQSFGAGACLPLWEMVRRQDNSESELRQRRSALRLLLAIGMPPLDRESTAELQRHSDHEIRVLTNELILALGTIDEQRRAAATLIEHLSSVDWQMMKEIENALIDHAALTAPLVRERLHEDPNEAAREGLRRVDARIANSGRELPVKLKRLATDQLLQRFFLTASPMRTLRTIDIEYDPFTLRVTATITVGRRGSPYNRPQG